MVADRSLDLNPRMMGPPKPLCWIDVLPVVPHASFILLSFVLLYEFLFILEHFSTVQSFLPDLVSAGSLL